MSNCRNILWTFAAISLLVATLGTTVAGAYEDRPLQVTVTVQDNSGHGLSGIVVSLALTTDLAVRPVVDALTDDAGQAMLRAFVPPLQEMIEIRHAFAHPDLSNNKEQRSAIHRLNELRTRYIIPNSLSVRLDQTQLEYEVTITVLPGVEVIARAVDEEGRPQDCRLWGPQHSSFGFFEKGQFKPLRPIRQGVESLIFVTSFRETATIVKPIHLTAEQTQSNVDLGAIRIDGLRDSVPFDMRLGYSDRFAIGTLPVFGGATFINPEGDLIVSFRGFPNPQDSRFVRLLDPDKQLFPSLPSGKYFVVPKDFHYSDDQIELITAILNKRDLSESGIPMIEVTRDGPNEFEINVMEAHNAIRKLAETVP